MERQLDIVLSSVYAWPAVGGTETLVRTASTQLAERHRVRCYAHRIDDQPTRCGALDRSSPFTDQRDPSSSVVTRQLRLTRLEAAVLAPVRLLGVSPLQRVLRRLRLKAVNLPLEAYHAAVAGRSFARQYAGADVIHRFNGNRMALATVRAARRLGCPVIITPLAHPGQWDDDPISARAYREADLVVATSRADAMIYVSLGVAPGRVRVCPLPSAEVQRAPPPPGFPVGDSVVLFLGARRDYKGVDVLLAAAGLLGRSAPGARVAFVGPGAALARPLPPNVLDVGEVTPGDRDAWIANASVLCLPSLAESFGLVVSEAWSARVPVVTSDIPVLAERVKESGGGLAVPAEPEPLATALAQLIEDEPLRRRLGTAGRDYWQRTSSPDAYAAWHEAVFAELLGTRRPEAARSGQAAEKSRR